jgi:FkbM family methyltransferase
MSNEFRNRFFEELLRDCYSFQERNTDYSGFTASRFDRLKRKLKDRALALLSAQGFGRRIHDVSGVSQVLLSTVSRLDELEKTYDLLEDDHSRQTFLDLLRYKILGPRHVKLPLNDSRFWAEYDSVDARFLKERRTLAFWGWDFHLYEPEEGLRLHCNHAGILNTFRLEQYAYRRDGQSVSASEGDVVIDGGGCTGDTTLYFAARVGSKGRVYTFEFEQRNLEIMAQNLALNPHLSASVEIVPRALWGESDEALDYDPNGPATTIALKEEPGTTKAMTLSIDDLVEREGLDKVDFVKMDIEGAELSALKGAERTLRAFRPTLAISAYHREEDLVNIPAYIDGLELGYEFLLDHFTLHQAETVLFARTPSG